MHEDEITINLQQLTDVIKQLEAVKIEIPQEEKDSIVVIQDSLKQIVTLLTPEELSEEQLKELDSIEKEKEEYDISIQTNLVDLNENITNLTQIIETDIQSYNELDDLQIKAYGSNIILMYIVLFALFVKFVFSIFSFFGNKI